MLCCMSIPLCSCAIKDRVDSWLDEQLGLLEDNKDSTSTGEENGGDSSGGNGGGEDLNVEIELDKLNIYF